MRTSLRHLGINDANYKVLKLLPLVYVAWAKGEIEPERQRRILHLGHNHFAIGEQGEKLLRAWMKERPSKAFFMEGLHDVLRLARSGDEWGFDVDELQRLLAHSEAIARTTAEAMDAPTSVTPEEDRALAEVARELRVDDGESWAALLRELDGAAA